MRSSEDTLHYKRLLRQLEDLFELSELSDLHGSTQEAIKTAREIIDQYDILPQSVGSIVYQGCSLDYGDLTIIIDGTGEVQTLLTTYPSYEDTLEVLKCLVKSPVCDL